MCNEVDLPIVSSIDDIEMPIIRLDDVNTQLPMLAMCHYGKLPANIIQESSVYLCTRIVLLPHFNGFNKDQLRKCVSWAINNVNSLTIYLDSNGGGGCSALHNECLFDHLKSARLRDIWIEQTLAHYGTTVEQQLELCNVIV